MVLKKIIDGAYLVPMGNANAYLLDAGPELVLVDAGFPGKASPRARRDSPAGSLA